MANYVVYGQLIHMYNETVDNMPSAPFNLKLFLVFVHFV